MSRIAEIEERRKGIPELMLGVRDRGHEHYSYEVCTLDGKPLEKSLQNCDFLSASPADIRYLLEERAKMVELLRDARHDNCDIYSDGKDYRCSLCKRIDALLEDK